MEAVLNVGLVILWGVSIFSALAIGALAPRRAQSQDMQQGPQDQSQPSLDPSQDPPAQVARISLLAGNVSYEPASVDQFSPAEMNYPMTTGDRLYTDVASNGEVQTGNLALRMGAQTDLTVTAITDTLQQFGLGQGAVHLCSSQLDPNATVELDTPNVAVTVLQPGDVRVDVDPNADVTVVTVLAGQVEVDGNGLQQVLQQGDSVRLIGSNPVSAQWVRPGRQDALDQFSASRDSVYQQGYASESGYLNSETIGASDLSTYGSWESDPDYGDVWYPSAVGVGWSPYTVGHWAWIAPWGWTWVEAEPWGFAPFHYGRWYHRGERWGWIPGPPVIRPVWSPALVAFVGAPGGSVTAWFALGPREPFVPWYHTSTLYVNRVNVTNIYTRNVVDVRSVYNQRTTNVYVNASLQNRVWANRGATVAVSHTDFAAGHPVAQHIAHVDERQLAAAPILPHPMVSPEKTMVAPGPARAIPQRVARPTLISHEDTAIKPGNVTPAAPSRGPAPVNAQPAPITRSAPARQAVPAGQQTPSNQPVPMVPRPAPVQMPNASVQQPRSENVAPAREAQPQEQPSQSQTAPSSMRPLFNKAVPPEPRPSFDQQRQAIEENDPGRPLSPQQMNNIRQNQPAGQSQQRESVPHPAPAPPPAQRPAPPPQQNEKKH